MVSNIADFYIWCYELEKRRMNHLTLSYKELNDAYSDYKRKNTPNNKLKMNGEPKRRKAWLK